MLNYVDDKFKRSSMRYDVDRFYHIYIDRPIKNNNGGMKSPHMFNAWHVVKEMQPRLIIESGVWKGLGTWFFRRAAPDAKIISLDPNVGVREYTDPTTIYSTSDFLSIDWNNVPNLDESLKDSTLLFFDDHQNFIERLRYAKACGFKHVMTEDNYPPDQGDCYSPKKILSGEDYVIDKDGKREWHKPNLADKQFMEENVINYQELPPLFSSPITRWGTKWPENTPFPLLPDCDSERYPEMYSERLDYTWICYMDLK